MSPPSFLTASCYVAAGGAAGSWLRYLASRAVSPAASAFPWATLTVNLAGSLAMGLLAGWLARLGHHAGGHQAEGWRLLLGVGLLGGFTTFSAFSLEVALLIERGALVTAMAYVTTSLVGGVVGLFAGLFLMRAVA